MKGSSQKLISQRNSVSAPLASALIKMNNRARAHKARKIFFIYAPFFKT